MSDQDVEQETNEEFTIKLAHLASKFPALNITTVLVKDGEQVLIIPPDDLAILEANMLDDEGV